VSPALSEVEPTGRFITERPGYPEAESLAAEPRLSSTAVAGPIGMWLGAGLRWRGFSCRAAALAQLDMSELPFTASAEPAPSKQRVRPE
jgi:hypothetical protein